MEKIIGLKEFRRGVDEVVRGIHQGRSYIVLRRSKPLFRLSPIDEDQEWEEVVDFTKLRRGGVSIKDLLSRL